MPADSGAGKQAKSRALQFREQRRLLDQLLEAGWNFEALARAVGVRPQTVSEWYHKVKVARTRSIRQLESLIGTSPDASIPTPTIEPGAITKAVPRRRANLPKPTDLLDPTIRTDFFLDIQKRLGMTRRQLAEALQIGRRSLDNYMDLTWGFPVPEEVLIKVYLLFQSAPPPLKVRFERAVKKIFGRRAKTDPEQLKIILSCLAEESGYTERHLRRIIPPNKPARLSRALVEAFERAADILSPERATRAG